MRYIFIVLLVLYGIHWICGIVYLIHPFKCLAWMYHNIMGWHEPDNSRSYDGYSNHSHCRICQKEIIQDSQGNWFIF